MFGRKQRQEPDPPSVEEGRQAGAGLPTRTIPILSGVVAVGAALVVAFSGTGNHATTSSNHPPPQQTAQTRQRPNNSELQRILGTLGQNTSGNQQAKQASKTAHATGLGVPLIGNLVPRPQALQRKQAVAGNVAASALVALTGPGATHSQTNVSTPIKPQPVSNQPVSAGQLAKELAAQGSGVNASKLAALLRSRGGAGSANAKKFLAQTQSTAGNSYGPVAKVIPKLTGAVLYPGVMLPATTVTAVNTQLPGTVIAQVTDTVYGRNGRVAVPAGARLVGQYDTTIKNGQTRILVAFQRLIFPDGQEIVLGNSQATGGQGAAGVKGNVNNHFFTMLGASLLVALLDQGIASTGPSQSVTSTNGTTATSPAQAGAKVFAHTVQNVLSPYQNMRPTAVIPPGTPIKVLVNKTIVMPEGN